MKNMKNALFVILLIINANRINAQSSNVKTEQIRVLGNCEMCKSRIEKAGQKKGEAKVKWNDKSKMAVLTYDSSKQTDDDILKRIALAGYDNEKFLAPDEAYSKLPECCKYERSLKKDNPSKSAVKSEQVDLDSKAQKSEANALEALFSSYFDLKDAFVQSDEKRISTEAANLTKKISLIDMSTLKDDQHQLWMKLNQHMVTISAEISKGGKIDTKRIKFSELSQDFHQLAKVAKLNYEIYFQHCPMFNNGADWLSKDSQIKNPFYGNQMLTCGKTTETIK
jgi:copper chaperone CopZ